MIDFIEEYNLKFTKSSTKLNKYNALFRSVLSKTYILKPKQSEFISVGLERPGSLMKGLP